MTTHYMNYQISLNTNIAPIVPTKEKCIIDGYCLSIRVEHLNDHPHVFSLIPRELQIIPNSHVCPFWNIFQESIVSTNLHFNMNFLGMNIFFHVKI